MAQATKEVVSTVNWMATGSPGVMVREQGREEQDGLWIRQRHRQALAEQFPERIGIRRALHHGRRGHDAGLAAPLLDAQVHEVQGAGQFPAA
jgi:hypothetical protein